MSEVDQYARDRKVAVGAALRQHVGRRARRNVWNDRAKTQIVTAGNTLGRGDLELLYSLITTNQTIAVCKPGVRAGIDLIYPFMAIDRIVGILSELSK